MGPSTTTISCFLLPQLSWKASNPSSLAIASRRYLSTGGPAPWIKPVHCSLSSRTQRCIPSGHNLSRLTSFAQIQAFASCSCAASNHRQRFSTTSSLSRDHHFDTLKFVQRLKDEGFSEEQSKAMMLVLSDVIEESIQNLTRTMVLREGFQFHSGAPAKPLLTASPCRFRPKYVHTKSRFYKASLRALGSGFQRYIHDSGFARATVQRFSEAQFQAS